MLQVLLYLLPIGFLTAMLFFFFVVYPKREKKEYDKKIKKWKENQKKGIII